jgi:Fe-S cluster assembly protein SufD
MDHFHFKNKVDISQFHIPGLSAKHLVIVDGHYREDLSDAINIAGLSIDTTSHVEEDTNEYKHFFQAFGASLITSRLNINIAPKTTVSDKIHIIHVTTEQQVLSQPYISIHVHQSSSAQFVESFVSVGENHAFTNRTLRIQVEKNASFTLDKIQCETDAHYLMNEDRIQVEGDGRFTINTLTVDGGWVRNNLHISFGGQNAEANLHGIYLPRKKQHIDNHTLVDHRVPHCNSNELYKGLLNDHATGVFNGKVYVQPDAQKTNAFQSNANILLSDDAQMNTKPELEIYADDVKCSHGTTTGQLDEDALFYLKARGLGEESARRLLTSAFINDVLNKVEDDHIREYVISQLVERELLIA